MTSTVQSGEKLLTYVVRFYNAVNQNLHSQVTVQVPHVKDAVKTAIQKVQDEYKEDVSSHNAAITTTNGEGVPGTDDVATIGQLQAQLAEIQRQISQHSDDAAGGTPTPPPPPVNANTVPNPAFTPPTNPEPVSTPVSPPPPVNPFSSSVQVSPPE